MNKVFIGTVAACLLASAPVCRANDSVNSELHAKAYRGIPYVGGGFGFEERQMLRAMGKEDNLRLSFALQNKEYIGGAKVVVRDEHGKDIFDANSDGPLFFAKLPSGTYRIQATAMGKTLEQTAHIPSKGQTKIYFVWNGSNHETTAQASARK